MQAIELARYRFQRALGYAQGDRALTTFAELLRQALRDSDVIGRLGGDECVAVLTNSSFDQAS